MASLEINSIINKNSTLSEVKDTIKPYTFIEFITRISSENTKEIFLSDYKSYLVKWAAVKQENSEIIDTKELIQSQVINLLKIITISYATYQEQVFLANLNWDFAKIEDPNEKAKAKNSILGALPIFVNRIKDIAKFYREKRTEVSFSVQRNKIRGTQQSIEKIIFDKILSYLFNNDPTKISYVQNYLNVSLDSFVDIYSDYFDIDQPESLSINYNNIDSKIYFELSEILKEMVFDGNIYLREIPLIAQLSIDLSADCVGDKLSLKTELVNSCNLSLIPDTEKIALKKKLYEKYLGTDFYYLYKNSDGTINTDIFIKASRPTNNLLNQQTVDTPYTASKQLELLKNIGLFFKPDKTSILRVNTINFTYSIDPEKVEDNKVYIFPDPSIYGNVGFNKQNEYPYIIEYSFSDYNKNFNFSWASNDPLVLTDMQPIFAYYSKEQDIVKLNKNNKVNLNFEDLYNKGFITNIKTDLYGNKFALFKEQNGKFARDWDISLFSPVIPDKKKLLYLNGGILGEDDIGWEDQVSADKIEWTENNHYYTYFIEAGTSILSPQYFRAYIPNDANFGNGNLSLNNINDPKILAVNIDGGDFDTNYNDYDSIDGGLPTILSLNNKFKSEVVSTKPNYNQNKEKSYYDILLEKGKIFVSLQATNKIYNIEDVFTWYKNSLYKDTYQFFFDNAVSIDIVEDTFIIKAIDIDKSSHILIESIEYDNNLHIFKQKYINKKPIIFHNKALTNTSAFYDAFNYKTFEDFDQVFFKANKNIYNKVSDIFYVEQQHKIFFVEINLLLITKDNSLVYPVVYPEVHEVNLTNFSYKRYSLYKDDKQLAESFKIPSTLYKDGVTMLEKIGQPSLVYSVDTNMFMLTYIAYDLNHCPYIYKHFFKLLVDGLNLYGKIDSTSIDSTVYSPAFTEDSTVISPGDSNNNILNLNFSKNIIVS